MLELILAGLAIISYIASMIFLKKTQVRRLWLILFIFIIISTCLGVSFMHFDKSGLLADATEMSELYFIYSMVALLPVIAVINFWVFRSVIWKVLSGQDISDKENKKTK